MEGFPTASVPRDDMLVSIVELGDRIATALDAPAIRAATAHARAAVDAAGVRRPRRAGTWVTRVHFDVHLHAPVGGKSRLQFADSAKLSYDELFAFWDETAPWCVEEARRRGGVEEISGDMIVELADGTALRIFDDAMPRLFRWWCVDVAEHFASPGTAVERAFVHDAGAIQARREHDVVFLRVTGGRHRSDGDRAPRPDLVLDAASLIQAMKEGDLAMRRFVERCAT